VVEVEGAQLRDRKKTLASCGHICSGLCRLLSAVLGTLLAMGNSVWRCTMWDTDCHFQESSVCRLSIGVQCGDVSLGFYLGV
jgi:hypothetical protein